jgi:hypothetical protein
MIEEAMCAGELVWWVEITARMPCYPKPFLVSESETKSGLGKC